MSFVGQLVDTPYGEGKISDIRSDTTFVVTPTKWELAAGQKPSFYLSAKDAVPVFSPGVEVNTPFGNGTISSVRADDQQHIVHLSNWKLADGKSPTLYLNQSTLQRPKSVETIPIEEPAEDKFTETFERAMARKALATEAYKKSDLETAKQEYLSALQTMQYVSGELTNDQKAKLLEQTVLCNNNLALSCMRTKNYQECIAFAKNALLLIGSLEGKLDGEIWKCLQGCGISLDKLRKEWKKKSLYFVGKAEYLRQNFQVALEYLEQALKLIEADPKLEANAKELRDLIADAQKRRNKEKQKEKSTWSKAFQKNETVVEQPVAATYSKSSSSGGNRGTNGAANDINLSNLKVNIPGLGGNTFGSSNSSQVIKESDAKFAIGLAIGAGILGGIGFAAYWWLRMRKNR